MSKETSPKTVVANFSPEKLQSLAKQGNADAQYELSARYRKGHGVLKHLQLSEHWESQAALHGHVDAMLDQLERGLEGLISNQGNREKIRSGGETVVRLNDLARKGNVKALFLSGRASYEALAHPNELTHHEEGGKLASGWISREKALAIIREEFPEEFRMSKYVEAYAWFNVAASLADAQSPIRFEAAVMRSEIEGLLNDAQIKEAQDTSQDILREIRRWRSKMDDENEEGS